MAEGASSSAGRRTSSFHDGARLAARGLGQTAARPRRRDEIAQHLQTVRDVGCRSRYFLLAAGLANQFRHRGLVAQASAFNVASCRRLGSIGIAV